MKQHSIFNNGQSKPRTANITTTTFIYPIEALKKPAKMFRSYSYPIVTHTEIICLVIFCITIDTDMGGLTGIRQRIIEQITENRI